MLCKIADLIVEIPEVGDLVPRCQDYRFDNAKSSIGADITIRTDLFRRDAWDGFSGDWYIYLETGAQFYLNLLEHDGIVFHASAVEYQGKAYLFSAPSGTGKSTHTRLWQSVLDDATVFNDDKPSLRLIDGIWYAFGTPWSGTGVNCNAKVPLAGICFLKQASENKIRRLSKFEAAQKIYWQTGHTFKGVERLDFLLSHVEELVRQIPVYELENRPEPEAARLSYETMRRGAEELGL